MRNYINIYISLIVLTNFIYTNSNFFRDPFYFSDLDYRKIKFNKLSKLNLNSNTFIVLRHKNSFKILKNQEYLFDYKIVNISKDYITLEDNLTNRANLILK